MAQLISNPQIKITNLYLQKSLSTSARSLPALSENIANNHMSKTQLHKSIVHEIGRVNDRIDIKILRGLPYVREARRHRMLRLQLRRLERDGVRSGWFSSLISLH